MTVKERMIAIRLLRSAEERKAYFDELGLCGELKYKKKDEKGEALFKEEKTK